MSNGLHELAEILRNAREHDNYVEPDLRTWTTRLDQLKEDARAISSLGYICEDSSNVFIKKIYISDTNPFSVSEERFGEVAGNIRIENEGRMAVYSGLDRSGTYVRGRTEYSTGQHRIAFVMKKRSASFVMSFNVVSKSIPISRTLYTGRRVIYGWHTDDGVNNPDGNYLPKKTFQDFRGELSFELQLILDCDNRKVSYFNQRTKNTHEMNVNTVICPFPWQIEFYLFDVGDQIELISSSLIS